MYGKSFDQLDSNLDSFLQRFITKPTLVKGVVHLLLILYAARVAPTPPASVLALFDNTYFKVGIFSLILWTARLSPSTSILIAIAFMVSFNLATKGKFWENMDNVNASTSKGVQAVTVLAAAAASPTATPNATVGPLVETAAKTVKTTEGLSAINALGNQAAAPSAGSDAKVAMAATTAIGSIVASASTVPSAQAVQAITALANAASSSVAISAKDAVPVASVALSATTTPAGVKAIQTLTQQAVSPQAASSILVSSATQEAISSVTGTPVRASASASAPAPAPAESVSASTNASASASAPQVQPSCYPVRSYDMSKVSPVDDGKYSIETYKPFTGSTGSSGSTS